MANTWQSPSRTYGYKGRFGTCEALLLYVECFFLFKNFTCWIYDWSSFFFQLCSPGHFGSESQESKSKFPFSSTSCIVYKQPLCAWVQLSHHRVWWAWQSHRMLGSLTCTDCICRPDMLCLREQVSLPIVGILARELMIKCLSWHRTINLKGAYFHVSILPWHRRFAF